MKKYLLLLALFVVTSTPAMSAPPSVSVGADWVSAYISRGIICEDKGVIVQPWLKLEQPVTLPKNPLAEKLTLIGLSWHSINSEGTWADPSRRLDPWYEMDTIVGAKFDRGNWSLEADYINFYAPNGGWDTGHEFNLWLRYNDGQSWKSAPKCFAGFAPYALLVPEIGEHGAYNLESPGVYLELGVQPSFNLPKVCFGNDLNLGFNLKGGFDLHHYYSPNNKLKLGYITFGPVATVTKGKWFVSASLDVFCLQNDLRSLNQGWSNVDSSVLVVGRIGFGYAF